MRKMLFKRKPNIQISAVSAAFIAVHNGPFYGAEEHIVSKCDAGA